MAKYEVINVNKGVNKFRLRNIETDYVFKTGFKTEKEANARCELENKN